MSEPTTVQEHVTQAVLDYATRPLASHEQVEAWNARVMQAYRNLSLNADFRLVLEDWTKTVLLNKESDAGARLFVIHLVQRMHVIAQVQR